LESVSDVFFDAMPCGEVLVMNAEELRDTIWDDLFRAKTAKSIDEIAALTACEITDVCAAVNHEWFQVAGDRVSIAYAASDSHGGR
jgi:hypothetical protein